MSIIDHGLEHWKLRFKAKTILVYLFIFSLSSALFCIKVKKDAEERINVILTKTEK